MSRPPTTLRQRARAALIARSGALLLVLASCGGGAAAPDDVAPHPVEQVVLITLDTLRASHTTPYGHARDTTPNLARFAERALQYERAYVTMPTTGPSHLSILTGLYPQQHGCTQNGYPMRAGLPNLAGLMRAAGHRTAAFVSARHLAPEAMGFDDFETWSSPVKFRDGAETVDEAVEWLGEHSGEPFFLWVHLFDPHSPYAEREGAPEELTRLLEPFAEVETKHVYQFWKKERLTPEEARKLAALYEQGVWYTDLQIGRLLDALEETGVAERALTVVTSDHGEVLDELLQYDYGFDHGKFLTVDEIRSPLWIRAPWLALGAREERVVETRALFGSILWAAGVSGHGGAPHLPGLGGDRPEDSGLAFVMRRTFRGKDVPDFVRGGRLAVISPDYYVRLSEEGPRPLELFDLASDPAGEREASGQHAEVARRYRKAIEQWHLKVARGSVEPGEMSDELKRILSEMGYTD